jgi:hypothetical protein
MPITHKKVSAIADGGDANLVQPSNWNQDHDLVETGSNTALAVGSIPANTPLFRYGNNVIGIDGYILLNQVVLTAASGTYTTNTYATMIIVEGVGGGAGGGAANCNNAGGAGGGGGSGAYFRRRISSPNASYSYVCGAGGGGGSATAGANGNNGANTTFDAGGAQNLVAPGGSRGWGTATMVNNSAVKYTGWPGSGGTVATGNNANAANGDLFACGGSGEFGGSSSRTSSWGGHGGDSRLGGSAAGAIAGAANTNNAGTSAVNGGGGGGAAAAANGATIQSAVGGNGGNGMIIIWEYA